MVVLRRTNKLAKALAVTAPTAAQSDTALGDWYVNRLTADRRPLLLLVSSRGLLPILLPARDVRSLPDRLPALVASRLRDLAIAPRVVQAEVDAMRPVTIGVTISRSVVGIMVDFAKSVPHYLTRDLPDDEALRLAEARLAETPCYAGKRFEDVVFPNLEAPALLQARWGAGSRTLNARRRSL